MDKLRIPGRVASWTIENPLLLQAYMHVHALADEERQADNGDLMEWKYLRLRTQDNFDYRF